jgi:L-amino acid N-acyltransferase YncA
VPEPVGTGSAVSESMRIRPMTPDDADAVLAIYETGIDEGDATFETLAPTWHDFDRARLPQPASSRSGLRT